MAGYFISSGVWQVHEYRVWLKNGQCWMFLCCLAVVALAP